MPDPPPSPRPPRPPHPLLSPPAPPPRLTARRLPAYRHVPGLTPHPVNHPEGHSHGRAEPPLAAAAVRLPEEWRGCEEYLYGADLYNRAFFWEAHEAWEAVWHAAGHGSIPGFFLQGLIQVAAGALKRHLEVTRGARSLEAKAARRLTDVAAWMKAEGWTEPVYMGVHLPPWRRRAGRYLRGESNRFPYLRLRD